MPTLAAIRGSLRDRGLANSLRLGGRWGAWRLVPPVYEAIERCVATVAERRFDLRFGTDTASDWSQAVADAPPATIGSCSPYEATTPRALELIVRATGCVPEERVFVDIGCGKGKVLLLACEMGFKRVIGVEHSPRLAAIARSNAAIYAGRHTGSPITVEEADATRYALPPAPLLLFLYNPFDAVLMRRFLESIATSLRDTLRPLTLVYLNPRHADLLAAAPFLRRTGIVETLLNRSCYIYEAS